MRKEDIREGLRVIDPVNTPGITYTWIVNGRFIDGQLIYYVCNNCSGADVFILREDEEYQGLRGYFCIQCAGLDNLEPIVQIVK